MNTNTAKTLMALSAMLLMAAGTAWSAEPRQGGNLVLGTFGEPVIFNPLYSEDVPSSNVEGMIYTQLMIADEELNMVPRLAVGQPEISDDGLKWTYTIHEDVLFHDGEPLTADDVAFTYRIFLHDDYTGPRSGDFSALEGVEALDEHTVRFTLSEPDASFATRTDYGILPEHILGDVPVAELGNHNEFNIDNPIGAGPFEFVEWNSGQSIVLDAFEDYFDGRAHVDRVTFRIGQDDNAVILMLETGEADVFVGVPAEEVPTLEFLDHINISSTLSLAYEWIGYNLRRPPFDDKRVRQALTHAIDRQEIVDTILDGQAEVAHAPMSPLSWAYSDDVPQFNYDPERALELLAEAGWTPNEDGMLEKDGEVFSFEILSNDGNNVRRDVGIIAQQMLGDIGIDVRPRQMEWGAFLNALQPPNSDFDAIVLSWALAIDPDPAAIWHSREIEQGLNFGAYANPVVDEIAEANKRILNQDERAEQLAELWATIAEDQPYTFLWYPQRFVAMNERVRGFTHHPRLDYYGIENWWLAH